MTTIFVNTTVIGSSSAGETISSNTNLTVGRSGTVQEAAGFHGIDVTGANDVIEVEGAVYGAYGISSDVSGVLATGPETITVGLGGLVTGLFGPGIITSVGGTSINNAGQIIGNGNAAIISLGDGTSIVNSGTMIGYDALDISGTSNQILNSGTLEGGDGIYFDHNTTTGTDTIDNSGTINGSYTSSVVDLGVGYGIVEVYGTTLVVENSGVIASGTGIYFNGATGTTDSVANSGRISGHLNQALVENGAAVLEVVNSGVISGHIVAIEFGSATGNSLDNSGSIFGNIDLTSGGTSSVTNSGHITGGIAFGNGDDTYDGTLGNITQTVLGGAGDDTLTGGAGTDRLDGGTGNDTIDGGAGNDVLLAEGTTATIDGRDGNDVINMTSYFNAADQIDGGSGRDTLKLNGNYATVTVLGADTLTNVEKIVVAAGFSYNFTTDDNNVAAGGRLVVDASTLATGQILTFNGSAETDGRFAITGGAGADVLTGGAGNDVFVGNLGKNVFDGGAGADRMTGGGNVDTFVYLDTSDSTSTVRDVVTAFNTVNDKFDLDVTVSNIDTIVTSGRLGAANFDANLTAALTGHLAAGDAIVFTPTIGGLAGHTFLIVDANGVAGYQAGQDYVMELVGTGSLSSLSTANFI